MTGGTIILLNGTSSSGKSSIAQSLQKALPVPYLHVEIDAFLKMLPAEFWGTADRDTQWQVVSMVASGFHRSLAALASAGCNIIADHVLLEPAWLQECVDLLESGQVIFVGVHCPLEELERREKARGDRGIGAARSQFDKVHAARIYDLEIDTSALTPIECAQRIMAFMQNPPVPGAFAQLQKCGN